MEKEDILNIADNLSSLKQNQKNYIEIKDKEDFDSYNKRKSLYNNWIIILCGVYNSLAKYYKDNSNRYWKEVELFISTTYEYDKNVFTLKELLKKYRNKNIHSENTNSIENNLLPNIVNDKDLEQLQTMLINIIGYEMKKIDICQIITHLIKGGNNVIAYKNLNNSINKGMGNATPKEKEMLEIPFSILINTINLLTDDTLLTEEVLEEWQEI